MKKRKKEPVYMWTERQVREMAEAKSRQKAIDDAFLLMVGIPVKVMHDKYGWRLRKRLPELAEAIIDEYQRFSDGEMTAEQYREFVFENCGMKFEME